MITVNWIKPQNWLGNTDRFIPKPIKVPYRDSNSHSTPKVTTTPAAQKPAVKKRVVPKKRVIDEGNGPTYWNPYSKQWEVHSGLSSDWFKDYGFKNADEYRNWVKGLSSTPNYKTKDADFNTALEIHKKNSMPQTFNGISGPTYVAPTPTVAVEPAPIYTSNYAASLPTKFTFNLPPIKFQAGGEVQSAEEQIAQLVMSAQQGDEAANQQIQQIMDAARNGDQQAIQLAQVIQSVIDQLQNPQSAKNGAKLNYIRHLRGICPDGSPAQLYKKGGVICKKCGGKMKKGEEGMEIQNDPVKKFKSRKKTNLNPTKEEYRKMSDKEKIEVDLNDQMTGRSVNVPTKTPTKQTVKKPVKKHYNGGVLNLRMVQDSLRRLKG